MSLTGWLGGAAALFVVAFAPSCSDDPDLACTDEGGASIYTQRIEPVLRDDRPKSCNQCHLSGVDLSLFVKSTPCQTMACMADQGLVDLDQPDRSLILSWIERAQPQSEGITNEVIDAEYQGFLEWIEHSARCGEQSCPSFENPCELEEPAPEKCAIVNIDDDWQPYDDPGGCSDKVLEEMFYNDVYAFRGRCHPCHWSTFADSVPEAPKWLQIGECDISSLLTLRAIEAAGYIDVDEPLQSRLYLKPLDEKEGGLEHGGGTKFHDIDEKGVVALRHFLNRYASCKAP